MLSDGYLGRAGDELARTRLGQYARYAELVERQEAALEADDLELFAILSEEIELIQSQIGAGDPAALGLEAGSRLAEEAVQILEGALARGERIRERLASERADGASAIRDQINRRPQARRYLAEVAKDTQSRLDVRS